MSGNTATPDSEPLTPAVFHVLLALADGAAHGYAIMQAVEESSGRVMGPGTIYGTLQRLEHAELVRPVPAPARHDDERRQYFGLTPSGRRALQAEARRLAGLADLARTRGLLRDQPVR
jgi:DNA-binding PadR family transcriptional regulator